MSKAAEKDDDGDDAGGVSGDDVRTKHNDTALHVLKGAIVNALGPRAAVTCGVRFGTAWKATLTIQYVGDKPEDTAKPSEADLARIQREATALVAADLPVNDFKMPKADAEAKYKAHPVNHTYVYDAFPVKAGLTELSVVEIPGCNVNACQGPHLTRTGELLGIFVQKQKYSKAKKQHSFSFVCGQAAVDGLAERAAADAKQAEKDKLKNLAKTGAAAAAAGGAAKPADGKKADAPGKKDNKKAATGDAKDQKAGVTATAAGTAAAPAPAVAGSVGYTPSAVEASTVEIVDRIVLAALQKAAAGGAALNSAAGVAALRPELYSAVKAELVAFQSQAYTRGYQSRVERQQNIADRL